MEAAERAAAMTVVDILPVVQHAMSAPNKSLARSRDVFPGLYTVSLPPQPFVGMIFRLTVRFQ